MKIVTLLSCIAATAFLTLNGPAQAGPSEDTAALAVPATLDAGQFRADMRKLWVDHITWTRLFIISDVANLPDKAATTQRLLRNQQDIGAAVVPFYGQPAGAKLAKLLTDHILLAAEVVDAAKARDQRRLNRANLLWTANADAIALFLSAANPRNWPLPMMKSMLHEHLRLTTLEAVDYLGGNYAASVADYEKVEAAMLAMADGLSEGIIKQFPGMFH